jgi:putative ABC transport system permease protein
MLFFLKRDDRRVVMSELQELYERRRTRAGDRAANRWLRRQLAQYPHRLLLERLRRWRRAERDRNPNRTAPVADPLRSLARDLRHGLRSLSRTPVLTATIVLTVGLGIGATTTIVSVVNAVLLSPLPYADPDRLVTIYTDSPPHLWPFSVADYRALEEQQTSFTLVAGYRNRELTFSREETAERVQGKTVTWTYFPLLGLRPLHGRLFDENDGAPGGEPVAVVSHGFWTRTFGADPGAVGDTVRLDGTDYTVVGVLDPKVGPFEQDRDVFIAVQWQPPPRKARSSSPCSAVSRRE